jgi:hypothetical protein
VSVEIAGTVVQAGKSAGGNRHVEVGDPTLVSAQTAAPVRLAPQVEITAFGTSAPIARGRTCTRSGLRSDTWVGLSYTSVGLTDSIAWELIGPCCADGIGASVATAKSGPPLTWIGT